MQVITKTNMTAAILIFISYISTKQTSKRMMDSL